MAQPQLLQIKLSRFDAQPWGFRLQGGVDFATPLVVQKVNGGSLAEKAGLIPGDAVLRINDVDVFNLRHKDAQDVVVRSGNNFVLTIQRGGSTWRPHITPTGNIPQPQQNSPYLQTVTKTSLAHKQQDSQHIGCGYNNAARPFVNGGDGSVKSIVNKQYNTPVGIYSEESIAETLSAQAEVLAGGVLGVNFKKNEKEYQPDKSEVLKFLREEETGQSSTPVFQQDHHHHHQQQQQQQHHQQQQQHHHYHQQPQQPKQQQQHYQPPSATRHVSAPVNSPKPPSTGGLPTGQNICNECERLITGVFVRIKDKNLHVECFKCATCGTSLKNQGYYNYNNKLYCDIHAKLAALQSPPAGTDGYVPVPIKPNTKLSATTISSALNAHGFADIPAANGGSVPPTSAPNAEANECIDVAKDDITDLPLPPPPSPTLLQQLTIESQYRSCPNDNEISVERELQHSSTSGSSVSPVVHTTQILEGLGDGAVDEKSSGYASTSPLHSRQTSSSSTSTCGFSRDKQAVPLTATIPPPPPPPLPPTLQPAQLNEPTVRQQNENDMNSQNQYGKGGGNEGNVGAPCAGGVLSPAGGVYSKFLKEYSNKLLTQNKDTNSYTNKLSADISHNKNTNKKVIDTTNYSQNELSTHTRTPLNTQSLSARNSSPTTGDKSSTINPQPNVVAALSATLANQLNFNSCQQVSLNPSAPPALSASSISTQGTTAFSETISSKSASASDNRFESEPLIEATESILGTDEGITSAMSVSDDQPFGEYVTLTGSVIRSVVPPGKGANINYKVNQGYARPFGAAAGPPAAAPKSPVAYPPQRPAVNAYATLPRSNIGQQELCTKPTNANATLPPKVLISSNTNKNPPPDAQQAHADLYTEGNATAMLTESIGHINMGDKMDNFMTEASKIISNMLEARLANNNGSSTLPMSSHGGSTSSLRSNCSSIQSRSPMLMRKRFELDDFKNVDPTEPVSLKPVIAVQQNLKPLAPMAATPRTVNNEGDSKEVINLPTNHPLGKLIEVCDKKQQDCVTEPQCTAALKTCTFENDNIVVKSIPQDENAFDTADQPQTVVYREKCGNQRNPRTSHKGGEISTHAMDRRSYIEPNDLNVSDVAREGPAFSINVRALGPKASVDGEPSNTILSPENEQVVSQLLKDGKRPICCQCNTEITKGPFITALGRIWCPEHFICVNANCRRPLQDIGFVEEKGDLYCEYCFEKYLAPSCSKCGGKIKGDCLNAIGKQFHPECFTCGHCGKLFGNTPFFLEDGNAYCEADWNELFTTKCFACGFPVEAGDRWVEALNHNYHSQCFNCTYCKQNLEGQSFYNKGGRPFCKNHAR